LRSIRLVTCLAALLCAGCPGEPRGPELERLPEDVFAPAAWETSWEKDELDTWREGIVVDLPPDCTLGTDDLTPVAGAVVELYVPAPSGSALPEAPAATVESDAAGKFRVGPAPLDAWILRAKHPDRATAFIGVGSVAEALGAAAPLPGGRDRVALRRRVEVRGRVVDQDKRPVAGVHVAATSMAYRQELTTAADGTFTAHTPRGPIHFEVEDVRFAAKPDTVVVALDKPPPEPTLRVREQPPLRGRVFAGAERRPAAGAVVLCLEEPSRQTRADSEGRFELQVGAGQHVAAAAGGYGWRTCPAPRAGEAELRILPVPPVRGIVVDAEGRPVAGARVTGVVANYDAMFERVLGPLSGPDGRFTMTWLPRPPRGVDAPPRLVATRRGLGESAIVDVTDAARATELRLVLRGVRDLRGRATSGGGVPVSGAQVTATWGHWDDSASPAEVGVLGLSESATALTAADGTWRIRNVPVGLHAKVECAWQGFVKELMLEGPIAAKQLDFEFAGGGTIAGRVVASGGGRAEGAIRVTAQLVNAEGNTGGRAVEAAADGSFRFDDLPPGSYQIRAEGPSYDLPSGGVYETGQTSIVVEMERSGRLTLRLEFDGGQAPDVPLLAAMTPESKKSQPFTFRIGAGRGAEPVVLTKLDPGAWKLTITGDVWRAAVDRIELGDGETKEIAVRVARTIRMAAKVLDSRGVPVARQLVVVTPEDPSVSVPQTAMTGADGVADLTGLAPGRWTARCEHDGDVPFDTGFTVNSGDNPPLELRAPAGGTIDVSATNENGEPLADAVVALSAPDGGAVHAWGPGNQGLSSRFRTDAQGRVSIRGVRAGRVAVSVSVGNSVLKKTEIEMKGGATEAIEVR
jgi:uncharacterized GH25 family protein